MKTTFRLKLTLSYLLLIVIMLLLTNNYGLPAIRNKIIDETETAMYEEASSIEKEYVSNIVSFYSALNVTLPQLRKQFRSLYNISNVRIWLVNESGNILIDTDTANNREGKNINQYDSSFLINETCTDTYLKNLQNEKMLSIIYPLTSDFSIKGYLVLMSPLKLIQERSIQYTDCIIVCFLFLFVALFLIFLYLNYEFSHPIQAITIAVKNYASGHFDQQIDPHNFPNREYLELTAAVQYLAEKMSSMNDYQKKFITNVSHDFRSPLTSIKGYTEAMLDGTIPPEMQEKYLDIILFETERLTKLTSNLLELNQFENKKMLLEIETFNINNAIKMTTASFEQRCTEKRITLNLIFSSKNLLVDADINKIEQVIQNLVDNAIKFSPNDSIIDISTASHSGKIFVSIKDHGIGIPKNNLGKIWNRFYKTDLSRGKDKTGTGLGLSITKEIIEAHGENINVVSTEGVGTEFIFSLKAHTSHSNHR